MSDNVEYWLVPEKDESGNETGYYTRQPDGVSGMTVSALSEFCGLAAGSTSAVSTWLDLIESSDPETNSLPDPMKPFAGKRLRLETNDLQGRLIIPDEACQAIAEYYAFEARSYPGQNIARNNCRVLMKTSLRFFIWSKTGYQPTQRKQIISFNDYTLGRIAVHHSALNSPMPDGYFSCFDKMIEILQKLDIRLGYQLAEQWYDTRNGTERFLEPDISIGLLFSSLFTSKYLEEYSKYQQEYQSRKNNPKIKQFWSSNLIKLKWRADRAFVEQSLREKYFGSSRPLLESEIERCKYSFKPSPDSGRPPVLDAYCYSNKYTSLFYDWLRDVFFKFCWRDYILERNETGWIKRYEAFQSLPEKQRKSILLTSEGGLISGFEFWEVWLKQLPPSQ
jgi:hypothetical protein